MFVQKVGACMADHEQEKKLLTVVLPAYKECQNIEYLIGQLTRADTSRLIARVIYVDDDSPDDSAEFIKHLPLGYFPIDCIHRIGRQGLSSAVVEGVMLADTKYVAVMDADGQHKASDLVDMLDLLLSQNLDCVVGSRFKTNKVINSHVGMRLWISQRGNQLSNFVLKRELSDPLTGFFVFKRSLFLEVVREMRPTGFKILIEFLYRLRNHQIRLEEYPIGFAARHDGESKLDSKVILDFADQILGFATKGLVPDKFLGFILVGLTGLAVHMFTLSILLFQLALPFATSQAFATLVAMTSNFSINNAFTFRRNRLTGLAWVKGLIYFVIVCSIGAFANVGAAAYFNNHGQVWWLSAILGIIVGTVFNFSMARFFVWKN